MVTLAFAGANIQGQFMTDMWSSTQFGNISKTFLVIEQQDTFYRSSYDGITGLAYEKLAASSDKVVSSLYHVLVDTAHSTDAFGMLLCGTMQPMLQTGGVEFTYHSGQLLVGGTEGVDGKKYYSGDMLYTPITREAWFVVTVTDIGYDGTSLGLSCDSYNEPQAILDSGTSNLAFPSDVYNALMGQIMTATLAAIPDFDPIYFDDAASCCNEVYCDPTSSSAAMLELPSIYFTLGLASNDGSTSKHFTVEIPPEYYWRPEMNGPNSSTPCRALGISEGSSTVLGDVFLDGLYSYHDRANGNIGLAVADNCPNDVTSSKKVYTSNDSGDWCSCFSKILQNQSKWTTYLPWKAGCFFWLWWMYVVVASVLVVIVCVCVLIWWHMTNKHMEKLRNQVNHRTTSGPRTTRIATMQSSDSRRDETLTSLSPPIDHVTLPSTSTNRSARSTSRPKSLRSFTSQGARSGPRAKEVPMMAESKYSSMSSPRSPMSNTSSIALLSEAPSSIGSLKSWQENSKPQRAKPQHVDYKTKRWSLNEIEF